MKSRRGAWLAGIVALSAGALTIIGCGGGTDDDLVYGVSMTKDDTFVPNHMVAGPDTIIRWTNNDDRPHSVIADPDNPVKGGPNSDKEYPVGVKPGQSYEWRVPRNAASGTIWYYHCRFCGTPGDGESLGTGMVARIEVP